MVQVRCHLRKEGWWHAVRSVACSSGPRARRHRFGNSPRSTCVGTNDEPRAVREARMADMALSQLSSHCTLRLSRFEGARSKAPFRYRTHPRRAGMGRRILKLLS
jgi:hypothetical protein